MRTHLQDEGSSILDAVQEGKVIAITELHERDYLTGFRDQ